MPILLLKRILTRIVHASQFPFSFLSVSLIRVEYILVQDWGQDEVHAGNIKQTVSRGNPSHIRVIKWLMLHINCAAKNIAMKRHRASLRALMRLLDISMEMSRCIIGKSFMFIQSKKHLQFFVSHSNLIALLLFLLMFIVGNEFCY